MILAALHRIALMAERKAEAIDRAARSYESTQLLMSARSLVRACELFLEYQRLDAARESE